MNFSMFLIFGCFVIFVIYTRASLRGRALDERIRLGKEAEEKFFSLSPEELYAEMQEFLSESHPRHHHAYAKRKYEEARSRLKNKGEL